jgi:membrane fusion protein, copper/silver efflux system
MLVTDEQQTRQQSNLDLADSELQQGRASFPVKVEPLPLETAKLASREIGRQPKKRLALRWILLLLIAALVGTGYAYRARLLSLVSKDKAQATQPSERKVLYWVDPMHPAYKSNKPGTAPDCGMDLVPIYEASASSSVSHLPEGTVQISAAKQQLIGVQYGEVVYKPVFKTMRTVGRLAWDETKLAHVHSRVEGWVEQVFVDFTGKQVQKGQPLLSVYSPELWQTQQEYLLALKGRNELANSTLREAVAGSASLLEAARKRLELWDIELEQLQHLEHTGKPIKALKLNAPSDGFVLTRNAYPKQRVMPDTELYTIADISTIWVIADIYEYEAPEIKLGQRATVTLAYFPGKTFNGKVSYIYPQLDNTTRTLKVRIEIANHNLALKPDMFANVELEIGYGKHVVVPQEAVMDSGAEQTVFVAHEGGYFEPRKVQLGAKVDNDFIVLGGLKAGERIVTSANFLIDSESKLKSAAGGMGMPGMDHNKSQPPAEHLNHPPERQPTPKIEDHSQHRISGSVITQPARQASDKQPLYWTCSMHPEIRESKPGRCPKCGMNLTPKYADEKEAAGGK